MAGIQRLGFHETIVEHEGKRIGDALWAAVTAAVLVAVLALLAHVAHKALLFVSLGPIIYESTMRPMAPASSPRHTVLSNGIALAVGYACLAIFGLLDHSSTIVEGVSAVRLAEVTVALAATAALLALLHVFSPPAGSTLLLVSLGIMTEPTSLLIVFVGVVIITALAWALNRALHVPVPRWAAKEE
jgi:hypothetical protein